MTSDNGTEFHAEFDTLLCRIGAEHIYTSVEHPQANGAVERLVRSLKEALSRHIGNQHSAWKQSLPALRFAHMLKMHQATGFAPFELLMGRKPRAVLPCSINAASLALNSLPDMQTNVQQLQDLLRDLDRRALANIRQQTFKTVQAYNAKRQQRPSRPLRVGDMVLELIKTPGTLTAKALGPFKVVSFTPSGDSAIISTSPNRYRAAQTYVRHVSRLSLYIDRNRAARLVYSRPCSAALGATGLRACLSPVADPADVVGHSRDSLHSRCATCACLGGWMTDDPFVPF